MRKILSTAFILFLGMCVLVPRAKAGEIDLLVQKLVEKGILTQGEAQELVTETREEVKKQIAKGSYDALPAWVQNTKLKGDFRLRYQYDRNAYGDTENRARIRARLGVESKINDQMKVGIGIATGKVSDPRSTNITLGQSGSKDSSYNNNTPGSFKNIILDYAYGEYAVTKDITLIGGKFKNPVWEPSDLLWDTDLNPEGVAIKLTRKISPSTDIFMNNLLFILDEDITKESKYPVVGVIQPGFNYAISPALSLRGALANYFFSGVEKRGTFRNQSTNTKNANGNYAYNYNSVNPSLELGIKEPLGGIVPYAAIFGEGIYNYSKDVESSKSGFAAGLKFGAEKVSEKGQWQAKMLFGKLGRDAWLDIFPDSDRYSGKTYMKSYEASLEYGIGKNTTLALDYYYSQSLGKISTDDLGYSPTHLLQLDWNLKF